MSLFSGPQEHAANPPLSWQVVKAGTRVWDLRTTAGVVLQTFTTRRDAEGARLQGWLVDLYEKERRWYGGEPVANWRPWADVRAEHERTAAKRARRVAMYAAKFVAETVGAEPPGHVEPTDDALRATFEHCVRPAPADLYDEIRAEIARQIADLKGDPAGPDVMAAETPDPPAAAGANPAGVARVPVTLTDVSGGGGKAVVYVDPTGDDAMVVLDVAGHDLVGVDLTAGTAGIWVGADPNERTWAVVDRFTTPAARIVPAGTVADADGPATVLPTAPSAVPATIPPGAPDTAAERRFAALTDRQRGLLLRRTFEILEYDEEGEPGGEWSSDTTQALGELFDQFGIRFTIPADPIDDTAEPIATTAPPVTSSVLAWTGAGPDGLRADSHIRYRIAFMAGYYLVRPTGDGRWSAALVITDCGHEVPEAGTPLGEFATDADATAAAQRHETSHT